MKRILILFALFSSIYSFAQYSEGFEYADVNEIGTDDYHQKRIVLNGYHEFSRNQFILLASEINEPSGVTIKELEFKVQSYYQGAEGYQLKGVKVFIKHTTESYFTGSSSLSDFISTSSLDQVFPIGSSSKTYDLEELPAEGDWLTIDIEDFQYDGTSNLVIELQTNDDDNNWYNNIVTEFDYGVVGTSTSDYRTLTNASDNDQNSTSYLFRWKEIPFVRLNYSDPLIFTEQIVNPEYLSGNNGSVTISSVSGGVGPYDYVWKDEANNMVGSNSNILTIAPGSYSVFVSDQNSTKEGEGTFIIGEDYSIQAGNLIGFESYGIRGLKKNVSTGEANSWLSTDHKLVDGKELVFTLTSANDEISVGVSSTHHGIGSMTSFDLGWHVKNAQANVTVNGNTVSSVGVSGGQNLILKRDGDAIYFVHNDIVIHQESVSGDHFIEANVKTLNVELPVLNLNDISILAYGTVNQYVNDNADIDVTVVGAESSPIYFWTGPGIDASNQTIEDQTNIIPGEYSVSITSSNGGEVLNFSVTTEKTIEWDYLTSGIMQSYGANQVKRISGSGTTTSWARSSNAMIGEGYLSFTVPSNPQHMVVGLSHDKHTEGTYYDVDYAFDYWSTSWYMEGDIIRDQAAGWEQISSVQAGDVLRMRRGIDPSDNQWKLFFERLVQGDENNIVAAYPTSIPIAEDQELYIEVSIDDANGITPELHCDFGIPLDVTASVNHAQRFVNDGSVDLTVSGGLSSDYNFTWSNGSEDEDLLEVLPGTYQVTISDGFNTIERSFEILEFIVWDETLNNGNTISPKGTITKTLDNGYYGNDLSEIGSETAFKNDGKVEFTITNTTDEYIIGLTSLFNKNDKYDDLDYGVEVYQFSSSPSLWFYYGSDYDHWMYADVGDVVTIERSQDKLRYYVNGVQTVDNGQAYERNIVTDGFSSDQVFIVEASIDQQGASIENVRGKYNPIDFLVTPTKTELTSSEGGTVLLDIVGGVPPYDVLWDDGDKSVYRKIVEQGSYTVTVNDQNGNSYEGTFDFSYEVVVASLQGVNQNGTILSPTVNNNWNSSIVKTDNVIFDNEEGAIEFEIGNTTSRLILGLDKGPGNIVNDYDEYAYAFELHDNKLSVVNDGNRMAEEYTISAGDLIRVDLTKDKVKWILNNSELFEVDRRADEIRHDFAVKLDYGELDLGHSKGSLRSLPSIVLKGIELIDGGVGKIDVTVNGVGTLYYAWQHVETGNIVGNSEDLMIGVAGEYKLEVTDDRGIGFDVFTLSSAICWNDHSKLSFTNNSVKKVNCTGWFSCSSSSVTSKNMMLAGNYQSVSFKFKKGDGKDVKFGYGVNGEVYHGVEYKGGYAGLVLYGYIIINGEQVQPKKPLPLSYGVNWKFTITGNGSIVDVTGDGINYYHGQIDNSQGANLKATIKHENSSVYDIYTFLPCEIQLSEVIQQYSNLKDKLDGSFAPAFEGKLHFRYVEKYNDRFLRYTIYDKSGNIIQTERDVSAFVKYGENRIILDLQNVPQTGTGYYSIEVEDLNGTIQYLRFLN